LDGGLSTIDGVLEVHNPHLGLLIQNAKGNLAKRARSTSSNEDDRARFGLHGSDGENNPGVPQYVDPQEQSADMHDDLSGFDSVFS
jgi:hypothetical protein